MPKPIRTISKGRLINGLFTFACSERLWVLPLSRHEIPGRCSLHFSPPPRITENLMPKHAARGPCFASAAPFHAALGCQGVNSEDPDFGTQDPIYVNMRGPSPPRTQRGAASPTATTTRAAPVSSTSPTSSALASSPNQNHQHGLLVCNYRIATVPSRRISSRGIAATLIFRPHR